MIFFLVFLHTDIMLKSSLVPTSCVLLMFAFWLLCPCCLILTPSPHLLQEFVTGQAPEKCAHWLLAFFLCCVWHAHPFDSGAAYSCHCVDQLLCHWMLCFLSYKVLCWSSMAPVFQVCDCHRAAELTVVWVWRHVPSGNPHPRPIHCIRMWSREYGFCFPSSHSICLLPQLQAVCIATATAALLFIFLCISWVHVLPEEKLILAPMSLSQRWARLVP